jgi:spermidine dehydrogenase
MNTGCPHLKKILGMEERISRRDFLDGALVASGAALLIGEGPLQMQGQGVQGNGADWTGYTGEGDYKGAAGNTEEVVHDAHAVRDGVYNKAPADVQDTGELFDCAVIGGGFSGLSAGLFFKQRTGGERTCLILDNSRVFGGVAKRNEFIVDGKRLYAPQASIHFQPPYPNSFLKTVYDAMGLDWKAFGQYQTWKGPSPEIPLPRSPYRLQASRT